MLIRVGQTKDARRRNAQRLKIMPVVLRGTP